VESLKAHCKRRLGPRLCKSVDRRKRTFWDALKDAAVERLAVKGEGLVVRSVGLARATTRLGLANLVTNMRRLAWFGTRLVPA
jgi:hypothetical protein